MLQDMLQFSLTLTDKVLKKTKKRKPFEKIMHSQISPTVQNSSKERYIHWNNKSNLEESCKEFTEKSGQMHEC